MTHRHGQWSHHCLLRNNSSREKGALSAKAPRAGALSRSESETILWPYRPPGPTASLRPESERHVTYRVNAAASSACANRDERAARPTDAVDEHLQLLETLRGTIALSDTRQSAMTADRPRKDPCELQR